MNQIATITSKKQLTLPSKLFNKVGLKIGQKVVISEQEGRLVITPAEYLIEELAGILKPIKKWKGKTEDQIIKQAKIEYFKNKR